MLTESGALTTARVLANQRLTWEAKNMGDFYLIEVQIPDSIKSVPVQMGQFFMLRAWAAYPLLSRPISVFNVEENRLSFLYKVVGEGTELLSGLKEQDEISLLGPLGRGFPAVMGKIALVGGAAGIAPLHLAAKQIKAACPDCCVTAFLGFSGKPFLAESFKRAADRLVIKEGGFITDEVNPAEYDHIFSCGPEAMTKALFEKCLAAGKSGVLHVSLEKRMACGIGVCFACSLTARAGGTAGGVSAGSKKVCKDGPVFLAEEVFGI